MIYFRCFVLFLNRFVISNRFIPLGFRFVVVRALAVIVVPLRASLISLCSFLIPLRFGLLFLRLRGGWLFAALGAVIGTFFLLFVPVSIIIPVTVVAVSAIFVFAVAVEAGQTFLFQQVHRLLRFGAVCFFQ